MHSINIYETSLFSPAFLRVGIAVHIKMLPRLRRVVRFVLFTVLLQRLYMLKKPTETEVREVTTLQQRSELHHSRVTAPRLSAVSAFRLLSE